jgi:hypothetical protein
MTTTSLYDLTPGTRVIVANAMGHLSGQRGVVVEMAEKLLNGHDCCVLLDRDSFPEGDKWPLCFYAHELAVVK